MGTCILPDVQFTLLVPLNAFLFLKSVGNKDGCLEARAKLGDFGATFPQKTNGLNKGVARESTSRDSGKLFGSGGVRLQCHKFSNYGRTSTLLSSCPTLYIYGHAMNVNLEMKGLHARTPW